MTDGADRYLRLEELSKIYPGAAAPSVDRVDLTLRRGRMLALLGPSGCGKTTLLRMIAGLVEPTAGRVVVEGRDLSGVKLHRRGMGMVFQSYALLPHLSVAGNVAFGLEMRKVPRAERERRVAAMLELVQLGPFAGRRIAALSGGQQQRVALARALVVEPTLLLLDEPLANLDVKLRESLRAEIRALQRRLGVTAIFVTHDQDEALSTADLVAVMNKGRIAQIGTPAHIYDRPADRFVAEFVGRGNFLKARAAGMGLAEVEGLGAMPLAAATAWAGTRTLMIRPHRIDLALLPTGGGPQDGRFTCAGTVEDVVYTGEWLSSTVRVGPHRIVCDQMTRAGAQPFPGAQARLSWHRDDVTLLGDGA